MIPDPRLMSRFRKSIEHYWGKPFRAGLWLGGLLLKPQTLILILPALLLQRSWKALIGFAAASLAVVGVSIGIGGSETMHSLTGLWLGSVSGIPTNNPQFMTNWRMIGIHMSPLIGPWAAWGVALVGLSITALTGLSFGSVRSPPIHRNSGSHCWELWPPPASPPGTLICI